MEPFDSAHLRLQRLKEIARYVQSRPDGVTLGEIKRFAVLHFGMIDKTFDKLLESLKYAEAIEVRKNLRFYLTQAGKRWLAES